MIQSIWYSFIFLIFFFLGEQVAFSSVLIQPVDSGKFLFFLLNLQMGVFISEAQAPFQRGDFYF